MPEYQNRFNIQRRQNQNDKVTQKMQAAKTYRQMA